MIKQFNRNFFGFIVLFFSLTLVATSCSKYEENSGISLKSKTKRIAQTWKIDGFVLTDGTAKAPGEEEGYIEFTKEGKVISHYSDGSTATGDWSFSKDKKNLNWSNEYVTDIEEIVYFNGSIILKLTAKEFWLQEAGKGIITKFSVK